jgi:hypothetical protein
MLPRILVKKSLWLWLLSCLLVLAVCDWILWRKHTVSVSPDGTFKLVVWAGSNGPDDFVRISLSGTKWLRWPQSTIYSDGKDRWPKLTEVYWDTDSTRVGVLVCDALAGNIVFAYDLVQRRPISTEAVVDGIRRSLHSRYNLTDRQMQAYKYDPIECACDYDSGTYKRFSQLIGKSLILPPVRPETAGTSNRALPVSETRAPR